MKNLNLNQFADKVSALKDEDLSSKKALPRELLIAQEGKYETFYAPFDFINKDAKIVIVGITPGKQQASNALKKAKEVLNDGGSIEQARIEAKVFGSFSGAMRDNLVNIMDEIGLHLWLDIESTRSLFAEDQGLAHFTSALRYPVLENGGNFNKSPLNLKEQVLAWFAEECQQLKNALFVPLGPKPGEALELMIDLGILKDEQVMTGMIHPSPASAERVAYFIGKKNKTALSKKTRADKIDAAKESLLQKVALLIKMKEAANPQTALT
jgi:hypothetical protein